MEVLTKAIKDYVEAARLSIKELQKATGESNLMQAWKRGAIGRKGSVCGIAFEFHGAGVYVETDRGGIDVDFLPGGSVGGFDPWRLWLFVKEKPDDYPGLVSHETVKLGLEQLCDAGIVVAVAGSHLYVMNEHTR